MGDWSHLFLPTFYLYKFLMGLPSSPHHSAYLPTFPFPILPTTVRTVLCRKSYTQTSSLLPIPHSSQNDIILFWDISCLTHTPFPILEIPTYHSLTLGPHFPYVVDCSLPSIHCSAVPHHIALPPTTLPPFPTYPTPFLHVLPV